MLRLSFAFLLGCNCSLSTKSISFLGGHEIHYWRALRLSPLFMLYICPKLYQSSNRTKHIEALKLKCCRTNKYFFFTLQGAFKTKTRILCKFDCMCVCNCYTVCLSKYTPNGSSLKNLCKFLLCFFHPSFLSLACCLFSWPVALFFVIGGDHHMLRGYVLLWSNQYARNVVVWRCIVECMTSVSS